MIETKKSRHPSSIIRLLREAGGFHFLILALIACTGEGLGKVFLSLNGGRMLDSFLVQDRQGALTALLLVRCLRVGYGNWYNR